MVWPENIFSEATNGRSLALNSPDEICQRRNRNSGIFVDRHIGKSLHNQLDLMRRIRMQVGQHWTVAKREALKCNELQKRLCDCKANTRIRDSPLLLRHRLRPPDWMNLFTFSKQGLNQSHFQEKYFFYNVSPVKHLGEV